MKNFFVLASLIFFQLAIHAQSNYAVELEFSPPEKAMIKQFTGSSAMPIQANNVQGVPVSIPSKDGKYQLLWFTELAAMNSDFLGLMAELGKDNRMTVDLFMNDLKKDIAVNGNYAAMSVVPNSKMLSEAVFGSELKHNRAFLLDGSGMIMKVFLAKELMQQTDMLAYIHSFIQS